MAAKCKRVPKRKGTALQVYLEPAVAEALERCLTTQAPPTSKTLFTNWAIAKALKEMGFLTPDAR